MPITGISCCSGQKLNRCDLRKIFLTMIIFGLDFRTKLVKAQARKYLNLMKIKLRHNRGRQRPAHVPLVALEVIYSSPKGEESHCLFLL